MGITDTVDVRERLGQPSRIGVAGVVALVALSVFGMLGGLWKLVIIAWVAFAAMAVAAVPGAHAESMSAGRLVWGYGLASGAMITSAAVFLIPEAIGYDAEVGGFGVAAGLLVGFGAHTIGHRLAHLDTPFDTTAAQLTTHTLSEGVITGLVYAALPELGLLLGLAIASHKGPAGYAAARRLAGTEKPVSVLLLPAAGVGLAALPIAIIGFSGSPPVSAAVFGFAAGVFLHVAMDFLPECEVGSEIGEAIGHAESADVHAELDRLRVHAVASTAIGALSVFVAWTALTA